MRKQTNRSIIHSYEYKMPNTDLTLLLQSIVSKGKKDSVTLVKTSKLVTQVFKKYYWKKYFNFSNISGF